MAEEKLFFDDVNEGDEAPVVSHELTRTDLVMYAGASGDFNPMHHDDTIATKVGYPSVFGHGMFTAGVLSHYLTDWVGAGNVRKYAVRFKGQLYPGRTLTITAKVIKKYKEGDENRIDADLTVVDDQGSVLITGTATAALASRG